MYKMSKVLSFDFRFFSCVYRNKEMHRNTQFDSHRHIFHRFPSKSHRLNQTKQTGNQTCSVVKSID